MYAMVKICIDGMVQCSASRGTKLNIVLLGRSRNLILSLSGRRQFVKRRRRFKKLNLSPIEQFPTVLLGVE